MDFMDFISSDSAQYGCVPDTGYVMALRSCSALGMLLPLIIIIMQICSLALNTHTVKDSCVEACWVYSAESVPKM